MKRLDQLFDRALVRSATISPRFKRRREGDILVCKLVRLVLTLSLKAWMWWDIVRSSENLFYHSARCFCFKVPKYVEDRMNMGGETGLRYPRLLRPHRIIDFGKKKCGLLILWDVRNQSYCVCVCVRTHTTWVIVLLFFICAAVLENTGSVLVNARRRRNRVGWRWTTTRHVTKTQSTGGEGGDMLHTTYAHIIWKGCSGMLLHNHKSVTNIIHFEQIYNEQTMDNGPEKPASSHSFPKWCAS